MKYVVAVADPVNERGLDILRASAECEVVYAAGNPARLAQVLPRAHALLVRSETKVTDAMMAQAPALRVIGRAGMGVDNIDVEAATRRGIAVMNTPGGNTVSAAEQAIALLLALVRRIPWASESMRRGEWDRKKFGGSELRGKILGLVGLGRIGSHVATVARALGMDVLAHDPFLSEARAAELGVTLLPLDDLLARADAISLHVPATEETKNLLDRRRLGLLKKTAVLINTARGGVLDETALLEAVNAGTIAGAALDVFAQEPLPADSPLRKSDRILLTPHLAASTAEAQERVSMEICRSVREALLTGVIGDAVNIPGLSAEVVTRLRPLLDLGRALGRLAAGISPGRLEAIDVQYGGTDEDAPRPAALATIEGALSTIGVGPVSMVNALALAEGRGIRVSRGMGKPEKGFETTLSVKVRTDQRTTRVVGAVFGDRASRVILIDEFAVDVPPGGYVIVVKNRDVPGVIGQVGTAIGEAHINIGAYHVARKDHEALALIAVDQQPEPRLLEQLAGLKEVLEVRLANLAE
ncbi:MAG: phosphoglycerate dehydrogenase [Gemmatimonadetes bacterium]|nr:phosphoglycerate dehydrogenase [Gemmatimonadota bacterium]